MTVPGSFVKRMGVPVRYTAGAAACPGADVDRHRLVHYPASGLFNRGQAGQHLATILNVTGPGAGAPVFMPDAVPVIVNVRFMNVASAVWSPPCQ